MCLVSFYNVLIFDCIFYNLSTSITRLLEMMLHVALKVEVSKLIGLLKLEKLGKLGISMDDTSIAGILKLVSLDVCVNVLADLSASHLGTNLLSKEVSKLVTDASGLDETGGLAVAGVSTLLGRGLDSGLHLTGNNLLEGLEVILHAGEKSNKLLELSTELSKLLAQTGCLVGLGCLNNLLWLRCGGRCGCGLNCWVRQSSWHGAWSQW